MKSFNSVSSRKKKAQKEKKISYHCYGIIHDRERVLICQKNILRQKHGGTIYTSPYVITDPKQFTFAGGKLDPEKKKQRYEQEYKKIQDQKRPIPKNYEMQIFHALEEIHSELGIKTLPNNYVNSLQIQINHEELKGGCSAQVVYVFAQVSKDVMDRKVEEANNAIKDKNVKDDEIYPGSVKAVNLKDAYKSLKTWVNLTEEEIQEWKKYCGNKKLENKVKNGWHILALMKLGELLQLDSLKSINIQDIEKDEKASFELTRSQIEFSSSGDLSIENEYTLSLNVK